MPTLPLQSTRPCTPDQRSHEHLLVGGSNHYQLTGRGLVVARGADYAQSWAVAVSPTGRQWARTAGTGSTATTTIFTLDTYPFTQRGAPNITVTPAGAVNDLAFSPDGRFLAAAHGTTPFVSVYHTATGTKLSNPGTLPAGTGQGVAWSTDGQYLAVGHATSPYVTVYQLTNYGDAPTLTKMTNPGTLPNAPVYIPAFSPIISDRGQYLAACGSSSIFSVNSMQLYSISGTTITNRMTVSNLEVHFAACFSPDGRWLSTATQTGTPAMRGRLWKLSHDTLTLQHSVVPPGSDTTPVGTVITADGKYWIVAFGLTPMIAVYALLDDATPVQLPNMASIPANPQRMIDTIPIVRPVNRVLG